MDFMATCEAHAYETRCHKKREMGAELDVAKISGGNSDKEGDLCTFLIPKHCSKAPQKSKSAVINCYQKLYSR